MATKAPQGLNAQQNIAYKRYVAKQAADDAEILDQKEWLEKHWKPKNEKSSGPCFIGTAGSSKCK